MMVFFFLFAFALGLLVLHKIPIFIIIGIGYLIYIYWRKGRKIFIYILLVMILGFLVSLIKFTNNPNNGIYQGIVIESKDNYVLFLSKGERFYLYLKENTYEVGDYLKIEGLAEEIKFTTYESQFDFKEYLTNKGVYRQLNSYHIETIWANPLRFKARKNEFLANFNENTRAIIDAFLFFNKDYDSSFVQLASDLNIVYLFAVNGVYLHLLMRVISYLVGLKFSKKIAMITPLIIFFPYFLITFYRPSIMRVLLLEIFKICNEFYFKKKVSRLSMLSLTAFLFLFIDYHLIYQSSFYVGFLISLMMSFINKTMYKRKKLFQKISVPIIIYLAVLPFSLSFDGSIHLLSLIYQFIILPFNTPFVVLALISFYFYPFTNLLNGYGDFLAQMINFFARIDIRIYLGELSSFFLLIYYFLIFIALFTLEARMLRHFKISTLITIIFLLINAIPIRSYFYHGVYFINVGQGDAILLNDNGKTILIDTGGSLYNDIANETLIPFFRKKQINKIDYVITTHNDFDHSGALENLRKNFTVKNYLSSSDAFPLSYGDFYIENLNIYQGNEDENDNSLVLYFEFIDYKFLLMGDASKKIEEKILKDHPSLDCDILKVGHHGSNTSSGEAFIKQVSPLEAIISVGASNYYGHPHQEVIDILTSQNIKIRRTDIEGTIAYVSLF